MLSKPKQGLSLRELRDLLLTVEKLLVSSGEEVGRWYRMPPSELARHPIEWVIGEFLALQQRRFQDMVFQIRAVESGVSRALAQAFGQAVPSLPEWSEVSETAEEARPKKPAWWEAYQAANPDQKIAL